MNLDPKIIEAVKSATKQEKQDKALADKVLAWMNNLTSGNEVVNDEQSALRHLEMLYDSVKSTQSDHIGRMFNANLQRDQAQPRLFKERMDS